MYRKRKNAAEEQTPQRIFTITQKKQAWYHPWQMRWNRVYYGGCWWDLDITNDITSTANGKRLYGFRELTSAYASNKDYYITNIY